MSGIFGVLNVDSTERTYVNTVGQELVFDAVNELMRRYNAEINEQMSAFVERSTDSFKERYLLPGGGRLQQMGRQAPAAAVKRYGKWDVAYPIRQWGAQLAGSRVDMAYMTLQELDAHLDTIFIQGVNTVRARILTSIFEDDNLTWSDPLHGDLTIRRLANDDGTTYPPVIGTEDETTGHDHYLESDGATVALVDVETIRDHLVEHFGGRAQEGDNIVIFHNSADTDTIDGFTGYTALAEQYIRPGADTDVPVRMPNVPGRIHGRVAGVWMSEWDWVPDDYWIGLYLEAAPPLIQRVDPADTGLGQGLQLVAEDERHPMQQSHYEHRFGFGVGNRLSACVMEEDAVTYSPPSDYAE